MGIKHQQFSRNKAKSKVWKALGVLVGWGVQHLCQSGIGLLRRDIVPAGSVVRQKDRRGLIWATAGWVGIWDYGSIMLLGSKGQRPEDRRNKQVKQRAKIKCKNIFGEKRGSHKNSGEPEFVSLCSLNVASALWFNILLLNTAEVPLIKDRMARKKTSAQSSFEGNSIPRAPLKMQQPYGERKQVKCLSKSSGMPPPPWAVFISPNQLWRWARTVGQVLRLCTGYDRCV